MLTIRLQRTGKRNQANFRIVLAEKTAAASKQCLEVLGSYNPLKKDFRVKEERLNYWIAQRVQISPTLHNLLISKNLLEGTKVQAFKIKKKKEVKAIPQAKNQAGSGQLDQASQTTAQQPLIDSQTQSATETQAVTEQVEKSAEPGEKKEV